MKFYFSVASAHEQKFEICLPSLSPVLARQLLWSLPMFCGQLEQMKTWLTHL